MSAAAAEATGLYVYGITLAGVECPAETVDEGSLRAVVSEEPLAGYAPEAVEAALRDDPDWLERRLRAHEAVLERVLAAGPVAPFRFGTIFRSESELREALSRAEGRLPRRLEELRGTAEWGLKAWVDDEVLCGWLEGQNDRARGQLAELATLPEGRRYLLEKRLRRRLAAEANELAVGRAHDAHLQLSALAREARTDPPSGLDERKAGRLLLRAAYLLSEDARAGFERVLDELRAGGAELGIEYVLSGPWPPYSFVDPTLA